MNAPDEKLKMIVDCLRSANQEFYADDLEGFIIQLLDLKSQSESWRVVAQKFEADITRLKAHEEKMTKLIWKMATYDTHAIYSDAGGCDPDLDEIIAESRRTVLAPPAQPDIAPKRDELQSELSSLRAVVEKMREALESCGYIYEVRGEREFEIQKFNQKLVTNALSLAASHGVDKKQGGEL